MNCGYEWGEDDEHDDTNHVCILSMGHEGNEHECHCGEAQVEEEYKR